MNSASFTSQLLLKCLRATRLASLLLLLHSDILQKPFCFLIFISSLKKHRGLFCSVKIWHQTTDCDDIQRLAGLLPSCNKSDESTLWMNEWMSALFRTCASNTRKSTEKQTNKTNENSQNNNNNMNLTCPKRSRMKHKLI